MVRFIHAQLIRLLHGLHQQIAGRGRPLRPRSVPIRLQGNVTSAGRTLRGRVLRPHIRIRKRAAGLHPFQDIRLVGAGKNVLGNGYYPAVLKLQVHLRITDGHQHGYDGSAPVIRPDARLNASGQAQSCQYGQYLYGHGHRAPFVRTSYHIVPRTQSFFRPPLLRRNPFRQKNMERLRVMAFLRRG